MQACCSSHSTVTGTYWRGGNAEVNISSGLQLFLAKTGKTTPEV